MKPRSCYWCWRPLLPSALNLARSETRDHVYPKSLGGERTVPACVACNNLKGDMRPYQWREFRQANPKWWLMYENRAARRAAAHPIKPLVVGEPVRELARRIVRGEG